MQINYSQIEFEQHTNKVLAVLAKMKIDLDEYKKKENASDIYIQQRERILKSILEFITEIVPEYVEILEQKNKQEFSKGYETGFTDAEKKYTWKPQPFLQPDEYRTWWILEQKKLLPHLF